MTRDYSREYKNDEIQVVSKFFVNHIRDVLYLYSCIIKKIYYDIRETCNLLFESKGI